MRISDQIKQLKLYQASINQINKIPDRYDVKTRKHGIPATKEWVNSVFFYNKDNIKTIPAADNTVNKLIRSYFSLNPIINKKKTRRLDIRLIRSSLNKILVSNAEMKHTNNKVVVTVYLYNKYQKTILRNIKKLYETLYLSPQNKIMSLNNKKSMSSDILKSDSFSYDNNVTRSVKNVKNIEQGVDNNKSSVSSKPSEENKKDISFLSSLNKNAKSNKNTAFKNTKNIIWRKVELNVKDTAVSNNKKTSLLNKNTTAFMPNKTSNANNNESNYYLNRRLYAISQIIKVNKKRFDLFISKQFNKTPVLHNNVQSIDNTMSYKDMYTTLFNKSNSNMYLPAEYKFNEGLPVSHIINNNKGVTSLNDMQTSIFYNNIVYNYNYSMSITDNTQLKDNSKTINNVTVLKHSNGLLIKLNNFYKLFVLDYLASNSLTYFFMKKERILDNVKRNQYPITGKINSLTTKVKALNNKTIDNNISENRLNLIPTKSADIINKVRNYKDLLLKILRWNNDTFANYENKYYKIFIKKVYEEEFLYLYYTKLLTLNNIKFKTWFLLGLSNVLSKIYKKSIEFNFVNVKYLHLNSDIFTQSIAVKLRNRNNNFKFVLKRALTLAKLYKINNRVFFGRNITRSLNNGHTIIKNLTDKHRNSEFLNTILHNIFTNSNLTNQKLQTNNTSENLIVSKSKRPLSNTQISVLNSIKHKAVFGVRFEAAGRLSKRLTAARAVYRLDYRGNIKDTHSSYHGLSSVMLRGNAKPNIQYTLVNSKTRNGAFGLKGWVNSY